MKKYIGILLILTISLFVIGCSKDEGHWVLVDTKVNTAEWKETLAEMNSTDEGPETKIKVSENKVFYSTIYTLEAYEDIPGKILTMSGEFTWEQVPHIVPGTKDGFALKVKAETIERPLDILDTFLSLGLWASHSEKGKESYNEFSDKDGNTFIGSNESNNFASIETTFYGTLGQGSSAGEIKEVVMDIGFIRITYTYQWQK